MKTMKVLVTALGVAFALPIVAKSAEQAAQSPDEGAKPATCLEAVVNPVTGFGLLRQSARGAGRSTASLIAAALQAPRARQRGVDDL